jgi:short-subunit dehydrogenase
MNEVYADQQQQQQRQQRQGGTKHHDKTIVITGASTGIGRQVAVDFSKRGVKALAIVARNRDRLNDVASEIKDRCDCLIFECDVTDKAQVLSMAQNVLEKFGKIDVLVNNAGIGILGKVQDQTTEEIEAITSTNYLGMIYCTKAFLGSMLAAGSGHIVNVASLAASFGIPGLAAYCGSKFAVLGFSESLSHELHGSGIKVTVVSPIGVRTNFFDHPSFKNSNMGTRQYSSLDVTAVSKAVIRASTSPRFEIVVPFFMRGAVWLKHTLPYVVNPIVGRSFRKFLQSNHHDPVGKD